MRVARNKSNESFIGGTLEIYSVTTQEILERISRHCPEALSTYLQCLNRSNEHGFVYFSRDVIDVEMSEDFRPFKQNLKKLARENLLSWAPIDKGLSVSLVMEHG